MKTVAEFKTVAAKLFGSQADTFLRLYPVSSDANVAAVAGDATREAGHFGSMMFYARSQRLTGKAPVYLTDFSRPHPAAPGVTIGAGAYHGSEVPYWFQNLDGLNRFRTTRNWTAWDQEMSAKMADALAAFAKTGSPSTPAIRWPEWTVDSPKYVEFGSAITVRDATSRAHRVPVVAAVDAAPQQAVSELREPERAGGPVAGSPYWIWEPGANIRSAPLGPAVKRLPSPTTTTRERFLISEPSLRIRTTLTTGTPPAPYV